MPITPIDIQQHQFKNRLFGYDKGGVDHFLEIVADELERLLRQNQELKEELARSRSSLDEMKAREVTLRETLLTTQKMTDELKATAKREAELLINEGKLRAERIVRESDERRLQLMREIQELKRQKVTFESSLKALVESHLRLLDLDRGDAAGAEEGHDSLPFAPQEEAFDQDAFDPEQM